MFLVVGLLQTATPAVVERTDTLSPRVSESSGVVASRTRRGLLWTSNDSGDGPYVYATDRSGADRGALRVSGADAVDWEDLATGPCPTARAICLYAGDVGDNFEQRPWVTVYAFPEPAPPQGPADTSGATAPAAALRVRYPDGAHDVEALFVTPRGTLYLVTKGRRGSIRVYLVPPEAWRGSDVVTARFVQMLPISPGSIPTRWVTGAALSPDGRVVALRTYGEVYFFSLEPDDTLAPLGRPCDLSSLREAQGEAIAFLDERRLILTSEGRGRQAPSIHIVVCPE